MNIIKFTKASSPTSSFAMAKSLRNIIDDLKRPLEENEVWTLLYLSTETLFTIYRGKNTL